MYIISCLWFKDGGEIPESRLEELGSQSKRQVRP